MLQRKITQRLQTNRQTDKQNLKTELTHSPETLCLGAFYVIKHPLLPGVKRQQVKYSPMERWIRKYIHKHNFLFKKIKIQKCIGITKWDEWELEGQK